MPQASPVRRAPFAPSRPTKALLAAAAGLVLVLPGAALAQPQGGHDRHGGQHGGGPGQGGQGGDHGRGLGHGNAGGDHGPGQNGGHGGFGTRAPARPGDIFRGYDGRDEAGGHGAGDRRGFGHDFRAEHRFRGGDYRRPEGWYSHRWSFGDILPRLFWSRDYWMSDYWRYSLSPPPYGYVWVRDGSDALLINQYTGEVAEVVYDVFY